MAVVFESYIKVDEKGKWFIELKDTVDDRVAICHDIDEYSKKIEDFGADYGGHIDEVKWFKDEDIHPAVMDEIRFEMARQQEELEKEKAESEL